MYEKTKQILKGASSYLTSGIVTSAGTFVISIFVSRYLGKEGLGVLSVSLSVVLMGVVLSELGLNPLIMREFAIGRTPVRTLRSILLLRFAVSGVIAVLVFVAATVFHLTNGSYLILWGTALLIITRSVGSGLENYLKAKLQHKAYLFLTFLTAAVQLVLIYLLLDVGFGIGETLLALAATDIVKLGVLIFLARSELLVGTPVAGGTSLRLRPLLAQGSPFMLIGLLIFVGERADIFLLATFRNAAEAGLYTAADRFLIMGSLIDSSLFASTLPVLSSLSTVSDQRHVTRQILLVAVLISTVAGGLLFFGAPLLIKATFRFSDSVIILQVLSVALPAMIGNRVLRTALYSLHKERQVASGLAIASLASLALNALFIPRYGSMAAAIVTVVFEYALALLYGALYLKKVRSV